jgi:hypothetical protein
MSDIENAATARIALTQGQYALIDAADLPLVRQHFWRAAWAVKVGSYYAVTKIKLSHGRYRSIKMHRLLMGEPPGMEVDHRNRDTLDNRRANLRVCTRAQNKANSGVYRSNTSGYTGVYWRPARNRWQASIPISGHNKSLGYFKTAEEAARARDAKAKEVFGEFARLNFPV